MDDSLNSIVLAFIMGLVLNAQVQVMKNNDIDVLKFEYMGVFFKVDRADSVNSMRFHKVLLEDKPDVMLHKCNEENGHIRFVINDLVRKVYVITFNGELQDGIDYKNDSFTDVSTFKTPHFMASVRTHQPMRGLSEIVVKAEMRNNIVVFAKNLFPFVIQRSVDFIMMANFSEITFTRDSGVPQLFVTPFMNCQQLTYPKDFSKRYDFTLKEVTHVNKNNIYFFSFHFENTEKTFLTTTNTIQYGNVNVFRDWMELIFTGRDIASEKDCHNKISLNACSFFLIKYHVFFEKWCIVKFLRIEKLNNAIYPCMLQVSIRESNRRTTNLEVMVPFDYEGYYEDLPQLKNKKEL